ncbi:MAG: tRNA lysidine(34) synthetase TilS [Gammaproteobacteria bacterium]|nr:tRNA lysidine(34) synthetase TilS [Gammaproteobacteria bacterium]
MTFDRNILLERLAQISPAGLTPSRWLVAYSGGLDSSVLLHALTTAAKHTATAPVVALHVNHGLQRAANDWQEHCRAVAAALGVDYLALPVVVDGDAACGPEAAARDARYSALRGCMADGDCLLSAHHEMDQAETLVLNLMRGSGVSGLSGIRVRQEFGPGFLLRPLLGVAVDELRDYAQREGLQWIDDPSNQDLSFDRNFLRTRVIPVLSGRWPSAARGLRRSAQLAAEADDLLADLARIDLASAGTTERMHIDKLQCLSEARQRNLLRYAARCRGLPTPPATRLQQVLQELLPARPDAQPLVRWRGAEVRRYRGWLYLMPPLDDAALPVDAVLSTEEPLELGPRLGRLRLEKCDGMGIPESQARGGLSVRFREGGEAIRPVHSAHTQALRKLMQDEGIVPWMRDRVPLCYAGNELVAVADLWLAQPIAVAGGYALRWEAKPSLH